MKSKIIFIALLISLMLSVSCKEKQVTVDEVVAAITKVEHDLAWLNYRLATEHWEMLAGGISDSAEFYQNLHLAYYSDDTQMKMLAVGERLVREDEVNARKLKIYLRQLRQGYIEASSTVAELRDSLLLEHSFRPTRIGSERVSSAEINRTLAISSDQVRREMAYRARYAVGEEIAGGVGRLIRVRNQEAARLGYGDYFAVSFATEGLKLNDYRDLLDDIEEKSNAPYQDLLYRFGASNVEPWNLKQIVAGDMKLMFDQPVADSQWNLVKRMFADFNFDLMAMPIYTDFDDSTFNSRGVTPLVVRGPFDLRLKATLAPGFEVAEDLARGVGRLIFAANIAETDKTFSTQIDGAWLEGIAELFALMVKDSVWSVNYLGLTQEQLAPLKQVQSDLALIELRTLLVKLNFEYDAYRTKQAELNRHYWDLSDRILKVTRHDDIQPWAADIELIGRPVYSQNHLLGQIIAKQTIDYLKSVNRTVVGNSETRSFLVQNYFRFGSRYPWLELLKRGTGERLTPAVMVDLVASR